MAGFDLKKVRATAEEDRKRKEGKTSAPDLLLEQIDKDKDKPKIAKTAVFLPIEKLYSAPEKWNYFKPLDDNKIYEMVSSIIEEDIIQPILVWKVNKQDIKELNDEADKYDFKGSEYMVLSGHNRTKSSYLAYLQTNDKRYLSVPAIVYENLTPKRANYLITISNYIQRILDRKERRTAIARLYDTLSSAKEVAEQIGLSPRSVWDELSIHFRLLPELKELYDNNKLNKVSAVQISKMEPEIQENLHENYTVEQLNRRDVKALLNKIKADKVKYSAMEIKELMDSVMDYRDEDETVTLTITIPKSKYKVFQQWLGRWKKRNNCEHY